MSPIDHWVWKANKRHHLPREYLRKILQRQRYKCAWSGLDLDFTPQVGQSFRYATLEHCKPKSNVEGHEVVCYQLNMLKGRLNLRLFRALQKTNEWKELMIVLRAVNSVDLEITLRSF
jgi:hypothetical protein